METIPKTFDDRIKSRAIKIQLSLEILSNLQYLLMVSKPLNDDQIAYCLMLHDEIKNLRRILFNLAASGDLCE